MQQTTISAAPEATTRDKGGSHTDDKTHKPTISMPRRQQPMREVWVLLILPAQQEGEGEGEMTASSQWRGHPIYCDNGMWRYKDTGEHVGDVDRPCGFCGKNKTPEGHDPCLGTLPEDVVMNACCGHGNHGQAYIQYWDGTDIRGPSAMSVQARMIKKRDMTNHRYACMDRPKPGEPWLQLEDGCGHTEKKSDASCTGCKWR